MATRRKRKKNGQSYPRQDPKAYTRGAYKKRAKRKTKWVGRGFKRTQVAVRSRAKRRVRRAAPRRSRGRARYAAHTKGKRARVYQMRNRHGRKLFHVKGFRARRLNPGTSGLVQALIAVGAGLAATVAASYVIDKFLSTQTPTVQTGILVGLAGAGAFLIASPAIAAGVATGLLVVPLAKALYSVVPALQATPAASPASTLPVTSTDPSASTNPTAPVQLMQALHMGALHARGMGALHMGSVFDQGIGMGALRGRVASGRAGFDAIGR